MSLNYNRFSVEEKISWIAELEHALEVIDKLPQGEQPRWRGKCGYMWERICWRRFWKSYDKLLHADVDLEQVSYFVLVG